MSYRLTWSHVRFDLFLGPLTQLYERLVFSGRKNEPNHDLYNPYIRNYKEGKLTSLETLSPNEEKRAELQKGLVANNTKYPVARFCDTND